MQTTGDRIRLAAELSAGVQLRHHDIDGRYPRRVHGHRDAATVVDDFDAPVLEEDHVDRRRVAGHRLIHRVVDHLPDEVVQTSLAGGSDVHAGTFADGLQAFENGDICSVVSALGLLFWGSHGRNALLGVSCERSSHRSGRMPPLYRDQGTAPILWARFYLSGRAVCTIS